jgi:hypothetical protein
MTYVIILIVFIGIFFAISKFNGMAGAGLNPQAIDASNRFLMEKTGFKHTALPQAPIEEQIAFSNQLNAQYAKTRTMNTEMIRTFEGYRQIFSQNMGMSGTTFSLSASWTLLLNNNTTVLFHIAEKDMNSTTRKLKTGFKRNFQPAYPDELAITDPELSSRFKAWGNSADWLNSILSDPELKQSLLSQAEVDISIFPDKINFSDPTQENLRRAMGGTSGMRAAASNPMAVMELQVAFHNQMGYLLYRIASKLTS